MASSFTSNENIDHHEPKVDNKILSTTPTLRIGITENKDSIEFKSSGRFSVVNNEGVVILKNAASPMKWRIKIEQSYYVKYCYNILVGKFLDLNMAQELSYELIEKGLGAQVKALGGQLYYGNKLINDNSQYWVIVNNFFSEEEAKNFARENLHNYDYRIIKEKIKEPGANLEIFDSEYEKLVEAENVIRIIPESTDVILYIYDLTIDDGYRLKYNKYRAFRGVLEFRTNDKGKLTIICEIPFEKYIEVVLALEMKAEFPIEALKAQAIIIRSKTIAGLRIKHFNDPYDICASSHCQLFTGLSRTSESIVNAVKETIGKVVVFQDRVFDADYCLVCGGCTESSSILDSEIIDTLKTNVFDSLNNEPEKVYGDLRMEENVHKWIDGEPDVFCNITGNVILNSLNKFFRWEITYSRKQLEEIISDKEGRNIGTLYDVIPIKRLSSGRLTEIEIIASNNNLVFKGEMNIRKILSSSFLNSSCFYIDKEMDEDGIPYSFTIRGAGMGHGVGLCQTGAIAMALKNLNYKQILNHYFKGTKVKKVY